MQRRVIKILTILAISFFSSYQTGLCQVSSYRLTQADSLFQSKQYVQSLEHYQSILNQGEYTSAMLVKMAFVEEGLGHIGPALYYLNLYETNTHDPSVTEKMEELAARFQLEGYAYTDLHTLFSLYHEYRHYVSFVVCAVAVFFLSGILFLRRRKQKTTILVAMLMATLLLFSLHINLGTRIYSGIVAHPQTYLMAGPSPGASVVAILEAGHRFDVIGKKDVWLKIRWKGKITYVKQTNLLPLNF